MFGARSLLGPYVGMVLGWLLSGYGITGRVWVAAATYLLWLSGTTLMDGQRFSAGNLVLIVVLSLPALVSVALVLWALSRAAREHKKERHLRIASAISGAGVLLLWTVMGWWS